MTSVHSKTLLLMGLPRSGTTWLGKIFDSHPETFYSHEPDSARPFRDVPLLLPPDASGHEERLLEEVRRFQSMRATRVLGKLPYFPKSYTSSIPHWARTKEIWLLKALSRLFGELDLPRHVSGDPESASMWVWKSIESAGRIGALARTIPGVRVVFIVRHPCGVAASVLRGEESMQFSAGPSSEDRGFFELLSEIEQARSRGLSLARFMEMSPVERVAWRWALLNEKAMSEIADLDNCRILRYEDLCDRPVEVSRDLFRFAGLGWNEQTERFITSSTSRNDGSYYGVFKDPRQAANKWRSQMPGEVAEAILKVAARTEPGRLYAHEPVASNR